MNKSLSMILITLAITQTQASTYLVNGNPASKGEAIRAAIQGSPVLSCNAMVFNEKSGGLKSAKKAGK